VLGVLAIAWDLERGWKGARTGTPAITWSDVNAADSWRYTADLMVVLMTTMMLVEKAVCYEVGLMQVS